MSIFKLPEGAELDFKVYLTGEVDGQTIEIVLTVGGMTAFSSDVLPTLELGPIIKAHSLDTLGTGWRAMTRDEILAYRRNQDADEDAGTFTKSVTIGS